MDRLVVVGGEQTGQPQSTASSWTVVLAHSSLYINNFWFVLAEVGRNFDA